MEGSNKANGVGTAAVPNRRTGRLRINRDRNGERPTVGTNFKRRFEAVVFFAPWGDTRHRRFPSSCVKMEDAPYTQKYGCIQEIMNEELESIQNKCFLSYKMFEVKQSTILNAGDGLWATQYIPSGTILNIEYSKPKLTFRCKANMEVLDYYVYEHASADTICLSEDEVTLLCNIKVARSEFKKRYVHVKRSHPIMKMNDLAFRAGILNQTEYAERLSKNAVEFILCFKDHKIIAVKAFVTRNIMKGEEIGMTYGIDYWNLRE